MLRVLPIPKALLCDAATLITEKNVGGLDTEQTELLLENVRVCMDSKIRLSNNNTELQTAGVLYFDCTRSKPAGTVIAVGMRLLVGGERFTVRQVNAAREQKKIHHYEVIFA